jgi:hypothetical protein
MAGGTFILYDSAVLKIGGADFDLNSGTYVAIPVSYSYTPGADHSDFATQIAAYEVSDASTSGSLRKVLTSIEWSKTAANTIRFDADDFAITAGALVKAKYMVIIKKALGQPLGYFDLNVGVTTGVEATVISVTLPAAGFFTGSRST